MVVDGPATGGSATSARRNQGMWQSVACSSKPWPGVVFITLMRLKKESNRLQTLHFRRTGFRLFKKLEGGIHWAAALKQLRRAQGWSVLILRKTDRIFSYGNAKLVHSEEKEWLNGKLS